MKWNKIPPPVREGLIFVCNKCGKKLAKGEENNPSRRLASQLKKSLDDKKSFRVVVTGCLNVCPKNQIAIAVISLKSPRCQFLTLKGNLEFDLAEAKQLFDTSV